MFEVGWSELLVIALVAIVVIGPKDLPRVMRVVGQWSGKVKRMAREFQGQFNEALREAELDGVKESLDEIRGLNPMSAIKKQLDPIQAALASPTPIAKPAPEPVPPSMGQDARPASAEDMEPAAPPPAVAAPVIAEAPAVAPAAPPKRTRKPKPVAEAAAEAPPETPAPKARKPKAVADGEAAPVKKPRAVKPKPATAAAEPVAEIAAAPAEGAKAPEGPSA